MSDLPLYVINLDRAPERWTKLAAGLQAEGLSADRFSAIDAARGEHEAMSRYDEAATLARRGLPLRPSELGVFASHVLLWRQILESGKPAVILEDDVAIEPGFATVLAITARIIDDHHLIRLSALQQGRKPRFVCDLGEGYRLMRHNKGPGGLQAYALAPAGAARLLRDCETWFEPVDDHVDAYWRHGLAALAIMPYRARHHDEGRSYVQLAEPPRRGPWAWIRRKLQRRLDRLRAYLWLATHPPKRR